MKSISKKCVNLYGTEVVYYRYWYSTLEYVIKPFTEDFGSTTKANTVVSLSEFLNAAPLRQLDDAAFPRYLRTPSLKTSISPRVP